MAKIRVGGAEQSGLAKKPYSATLGVLVIISNGLSALSGALLAIDFLGYHAPNSPPHPAALTLLLVLGLAIAAVAQLFGAGRNEGISTQGWVGVADVLHIRLTYAALMFLSTVLRYTIGGKHIPLYPVGILAAISIFVLLSRATMKSVFKLDHRKRAKG